MTLRVRLNALGEIKKTKQKKHGCMHYPLVHLFDLLSIERAECLVFDLLGACGGTADRGRIIADQVNNDVIARHSHRQKHDVQ